MHHYTFEQSLAKPNRLIFQNPEAMGGNQVAPKEFSRAERAFDTILAKIKTEAESPVVSAIKDVASKIISVLEIPETKHPFTLSTQFEPAKAVSGFVQNIRSRLDCSIFRRISRSF